MKRRLRKLLFWYGVGVMGIMYAMVALSAIASTYATGGLPAVAFGLMLVSALPAVVVAALLWE